MFVEPTPVTGRYGGALSDPPSVRHPLFARIYASVPSATNRAGADHRDRLLTGVSGRVVEVGAGPRLNFGHYPPIVEEVLALEPEPYVRAAAAEGVRRHHTSSVDPGSPSHQGASLGSANRYAGRGRAGH